MVRKDFELTGLKLNRDFIRSQTEFICWDTVPRHQNIIRYRTSKTMIQNTFEVCDYGNFDHPPHWKYDTLIGKKERKELLFAYLI